MTAEAAIRWHGDRFAALLLEAANVGASVAAQVLTEEIQAGLGGVSYGVRSEPGAMPRTQTRHLRQSFDYTAGTNGVAFTYTKALYARYLALGAVIRPRGKRLVIPMSWSAQRLLSSSDGSPRAAIEALKSNSKFSQRRTVTGGVLLGLQHGRGRSAEFEPWFLLHSRAVQIAPRPWHTIGLNRAAPKMHRAAVAAMADAMRKGAAA